jgi:uncharacterized protein (TIGR02246 family)
MAALGRLSRKEVVTVYQRLLDSWNRRDAGGFAALFAERGTTVGFDGSQMSGPGEIAQDLRAIFDSHPTAAYVASVRGVWLLDEPVAILHAVAGMVSPGQQELNPAVNAIQSLVAIRESGRTKVALFQNTPAAFHGRPQLGEQLTKELTEVLRAGKVVVYGQG